MKIIEQSAQVWGETPLEFQPALERIERAGRKCYQSLDKIGPDTARPFVERIFKPTPAHLSVTEHSNIVYRSKQVKDPFKVRDRIRSYNPSSFIYTNIHEQRVYVFGNARAWFEVMKLKKFRDFVFALKGYVRPFWLNDFERVWEEKELPRFVKAVTVLFRTSRDVTHEIVRHRPAAYSQESQRYVKYDGSMEFIKPSWYDSSAVSQTSAWTRAMIYAENNYKRLIESGLKAQDARTILPNSTATSIAVTAYLPEWDHIFYLRTSSAAYPSIRSLMISAQKQMETYNG